MDNGKLELNLYNRVVSLSCARYKEYGIIPSATALDEAKQTVSGFTLMLLCINEVPEDRMRRHIPMEKLLAGPPGSGSDST